MAQAHRRNYVKAMHALMIVNIAVRKKSEEPEAGVVDEQHQIRDRSYYAFSRLHTRVGSQIRCMDFSFYPVALGERSGNFFQPFPAARDQNKVVPLARQL